MTIDESIKYWQPVVRAIYGRYEVTLETCLALDDLLGLDEYHQFTRQKFAYKPLPEDLKKLLVMLAGPHGKTILKMYRIKRSLE